MGLTETFGNSKYFIIMLGGKVSTSSDNYCLGYCKNKKGQDHMSLHDLMEVDGVHGQARITFTGVLTAVPTGCCQFTAGPH